MNEDDNAIPEAQSLAGVRVIDLSRVLAGPYAAQILSELGADVIKVEGPNGDPARRIGPFAGERSLYFASVNTGKRGLMLDLQSAEGKQAIHRLFQTADIVIENFRSETARALELTPSSILEKHPHLVVVTVSGYRSGSRRSDDPAFDLVVQAETGIMAITGDPSGRPSRAGVPIGDLAAGLWAAIAATSGYASRLKTGFGRCVEVPLFDATMGLLSYVGTAAGIGFPTLRVGSGHQSVVPYGAFSTRDGWIVIAALGDGYWKPLCRELNISDDSVVQLETNAQRLEEREAVEQSIAKALSSMTTEEALNKLRFGGIPAARISDPGQALDGSYVKETGLAIDVPTLTGSYRFVRGVVHRSPAPREAPDLGQHNEEVLAELNRL